MVEDKDKSLGDIDDIALGDGRRKAPDRKGASRPAPAARGTEKPAASASSGPWMMATGLLLVLLAVLAAFFYRQLSDVQGRLDEALDVSSQKLGNLESQLSATDETLNQSANKVEDTLALHDSEIRKLWGVSNDRNKKWIRDNQAAIDALEKQRAAVNAGLEKVRASVSGLETRITQQGQQRARMQTQLDVLSETVRQQESRLTAQKQLLDKWAALLPDVKALAAVQGQGDLGQRLSDLEAAIEAIDAHRRQVNVRLDSLEGR
jgi:chromosome segregation ATPase